MVKVIFFELLPFRSPYGHSRENPLHHFGWINTSKLLIEAHKGEC